MRLEAQNLTWRAGGRAILDDVSLDVRPGEFLGIVGPNGSGKSTLVSLLAGLRRAHAGRVLLGGRPLDSMPRREVARVMALVEQQAETTERLTGHATVALGRTPHLGPLSPWSDKDEAIVLDALRAVDMEAFAARTWATLSGGERQRLSIGRAFAQEPRVLLLDEPTNHLDIEHQLGLLALVRSRGLTVVAVLHDLNHALNFSDRLAVMKGGRLVALGEPAAVLTPERIADVFRVGAVMERSKEGEPFLRFAAPAQRKETAHAAIA
ncbi:ABC transporter ATP-binding protein [Aureimonas sp. ME7]|uniref:ABC transporter ATP-binding protein n=1 Tax=Aureimonas sp. ME7 TaxID=2744252 RepID=UPI0015F49AC7|nr:ABC transporter ATP-binding protein [Aureimonas sp. ME7]